jgi:ribonuclease HI
MKARFKLYTDGSIDAKTGKGAYGFILIVKHGEEDIVVSETVETEEKTTISVMEMKALNAGLKAIVDIAETDKLSQVTVDVYSDSKMLVESLNVYVEKWKKRAVKGIWYATNGSPVANQELFKEIISNEEKLHKVRYIHVKAHGDSEYNNRIDKMVHCAAFNKELVAA